MTYSKTQITTLKKLLVLLPILFFATVAVTAQTTTKEEAKKERPATKFRKGDVEFKAGVGILPTFINEDSKVLTQPVQATLSYRINPIFSLGAYAGYSSTLGAVETYRDGSVYQSQNDFLSLGLRASAHMIRIKNVDIYGGMMLSYNRPFVTTTTIAEPNAHQSSDALGINPTPFNPEGPKNNLIVGGFVGGSYYFAKNFNVFGEIGYGVSLATVGLGYKF
ncbi:MAG: hypothetical protein ACI85O_000397 [Saprospiraceae bacterium]|jgi:hypothetical protein